MQYYAPQAWNVNLIDAQAVGQIEEQKPDLVFLDVQMPGLDGFGVLTAVKKPPQVVFARRSMSTPFRHSRYTPPITC